MRRVFRKDFLKKVSRTSVLEHYGLRTLLYGTLLPGPDIGARCRSILQEVRAQGFEVGIHCWDHVRWQDFVAHQDAKWTEREMDLAVRRFTEIFGEAPRTWGAAGWQTNAHAARFEERFDYASDTRGTHPFRPVWRGKPAGCPQVPTTLPTLDELIGRDGIEEGNVAAHLLGLTAQPRAHVFTAHAELEGGALLDAFDSLLRGWKEQGYELVAMRSLFESLDLAQLPRHDVVYGEIPGRSGKVALQA
jgi:peptidoglycan/xylan/chitin deacetylase (PgdA/CDA1 family)